MNIKLDKKIISSIEFYLIGSVAFALPLPSAFIPILIILLAVVWLLQGNFREKYEAIRTNQLALLFISFYLFLAIGVIYSNSIDSGLTDLGHKLSLLIFPILLTNVNTIITTRNRFESILLCYVYGCLLAALLCIMNAVIAYMVSGENHFFYNDLALFSHPSYFSMYLDFGIAIILYLLTEKVEKRSFYNRYVMITILVFFSILIFLLASKMGLIVLLMLLAVATLYLVFKQKNLLTASLLALIMAGVIVLNIKYSSVSYVRFKQATIAVTNTQADEMEGTNARLQVWKSSLKVIKDNFWFGVGTGDVLEELERSYQKDQVKSAIINKLNTHNQFLQTFIAIGFLGFILLLTAVIWPAIISLKQKNYLFLLFISIIFLNLLVEAMLERQGGIVFYAFFNSFLLFANKQKSF